jgi:hypothetical protein
MRGGLAWGGAFVLALLGMRQFFHHGPHFDNNYQNRCAPLHTLEHLVGEDIHRHPMPPRIFIDTKFSTLGP